MYAVSTQFLSALRGPHQVDVRVEAYRGNVRVGGTLNVTEGGVEYAANDTGAVRSLSVSLAPAQGLWDALAPSGTTLKAYRGIRFPDGSIERVPLGVFDVDEQSLGYSPDGTLDLTAPDVWVRVARSRFEAARTFTGSAVDLAVTLASEAVGLGTGAQTATGTITVRRQVEPRDRAAMVEKFALAAGAWIGTDYAGRITSRNTPSVSRAPVWTVDASAAGVMLDASRSRSRQRTYNVVIVSSDQSDGTPPFAPITVADTDPTSPTYVSGSFRRVPTFYSSQLLTNSTQAQAAGAALLRQVTGLAAQLELTSIVNPALEPGDVLEVLLPARVGDVPKVERHLIDSITIPLTAGGTQRILTRSTRPEGDVPADGA